MFRELPFLYAALPTQSVGDTVSFPQPIAAWAPAPIDLRSKSGHGCPSVWISTRRFGGPKPGYGCPPAWVSLRRNPWGAKSAGGLSPAPTASLCEAKRRGPARARVHSAPCAHTRRATPAQAQGRSRRSTEIGRAHV